MHGEWIKLTNIYVIHHILITLLGQVNYSSQKTYLVKLDLTCYCLYFFTISIGNNKLSYLSDKKPNVSDINNKIFKIESSTMYEMTSYVQLFINILIYSLYNNNYDRAAVVLSFTKVLSPQKTLKLNKLYCELVFL